jgi:hypothetical protein
MKIQKDMFYRKISDRLITFSVDLSTRLEHKLIFAEVPEVPFKET